MKPGKKVSTARQIIALIQSGESVQLASPDLESSIEMIRFVGELAEREGIDLGLSIQLSGTLAGRRKDEEER